MTIEEILMDIEQQIGLEPLEDLEIVENIGPVNKRFPISNHFGIVIDINLKFTCKYIPEYNLILVHRNVDDFTIAHERVHAEIYCNSDITEDVKSAYIAILRCLFPNAGVYAEPILNYYQDIAVNSYIMDKVRRRRVDWNLDIFRRKLCQEIFAGLSPIACQGGDTFHNLKMAMAVVNYRTVKRGEDSLTKFFTKINTQCKRIYKQIGRLINQSRFSTRLMVRNDYTKLIEFIREKVA